MRLREAAKGVVTSYGGTYRIGFDDGDETEFMADNMKDLEELWRDFCKCEGLCQNGVDWVERMYV